jgi:Uma2 family endonuclease
MARMQTDATPITAAALWAMPGHGKGLELRRGRLWPVSPSGWQHGAVAGDLAWHLSAHVRPNRLGRVTVAEAGYVVARGPDSVFAPDVAFVRADRVPNGSAAERFHEGAPDLAAEVISPSDTWSGVMQKVEDYLAAGTRMVLVVDPRRRCVHVLRSQRAMVTLQVGDVLDGDDVVPGWRLPLAQLFEERP